MNPTPHQESLPSTPVDLSIVIPVFNKVDLTVACLRSLDQTTTRKIRWEVIVVDNASADQTPQALAQLQQNFSWLRVIRNEKNLGYAGASNQGARASNSPAILFLNNDIVAHPGWLEPLIRTLYCEPSVAAVGAKLLFPDGTIQHAGVMLVKPLVESEPDLPMHIFSKSPADEPPANIRRVYQVLTAACLMIKRPIFEAVGGFDEQFWNGYEDVDLCYKIGKQGWKCVYEPQSVLTHFESQSGPERFRRVDQNVARLDALWRGKIQCDYAFRAGSNQLERISHQGIYPFLGAEGVTFESTLESLRSSPPSPTDLAETLARPPMRQTVSLSQTLEKYNIVVIEPEGYAHSGTFDELADLLVHSLRSLGHVAKSQRNLADPSATNIILGYNLLLNPRDLLSVPHVIYQLEQLSTSEGWFRPDLFEILRTADQVWDYAPENIAFLAERGLTRTKLLPIGYHDTMRRIGRQVQDIDVLFYGCLNDRRRSILEEIGQFANVKCLVSVYGKERDAYIARSKIILNLHYYEAQIMEQVRISYLLNNHAFVISESSPNDVYEGSIVTASTKDIVATVRHYLDHPQERYLKAKEGFQAFKNRPMIDYLQQVIDPPQPRRATA
jgi:GT2 family glycosyltransferase